MAKRRHINHLLRNDFNDLAKFTFEGKCIQAKITDVYDGDTVTIVFRYKKEYVKYF